jgi:hypothetical protein
MYKRGYTIDKTNKLQGRRRIETKDGRRVRRTEIKRDEIEIKNNKVGNRDVELNDKPNEIKRRHGVAEGPPLCSSGQSSWLLTKGSRVRFPTLPDFLSSSGSGTGSTQPL